MIDQLERQQQIILLIEDDPVALATFQQMLTDDGYAVRAAASAETGLAEAFTSHPAAVLLDLHLPITDGLECLRRLRATPHEPAMPVAILTGDYFVDEEVVRELNDLGARVHFKPIWEEDLRRIVGELVGGGREELDPPAGNSR